MSDNKPAWYQTWFNTPFYHTLYQDRNVAEAEFFLQNLIKHIPIKTGCRILDIACGRGRHALYLAKKGYDVTGIDLSTNSIDYAREEAEKEGLSVDFQAHDMREAYEKKVDIVLNLFTSIGYFEDLSDNTKAIQAFYDSLVPGGYAVIDFLHVSRVKKELVSDEVVTKDTIKFTLKRIIRDGKIMKNISFEHAGAAYSFKESVSALEYADFKKAFDEVGFRICDTFGDFKLSPFDPEAAERLIFIVQK